MVYIARVSGSAYDMGYAQGQLLGKEIAANLENIVQYGQTLSIKYFDQFDISPVVAVALYETTLKPIFFWLLDLNWEVALPYIP